MALTAAIKVEVQDLEDTCFEKESEQVNFIIFKSSPLSPHQTQHFHPQYSNKNIKCENVVCDEVLLLILPKTYL